MLQKRLLMFRLNLFRRRTRSQNEKQPSIQVPVMNSLGSSTGIFREYLRRAVSGSPTSFCLTPWMVLVLTPMDDPRTGTTKNSVESLPDAHGSPGFANSVHLSHCTRLKWDMRSTRRGERRDRPNSETESKNLGKERWSLPTRVVYPEREGEQDILDKIIYR